ncbi:MAG: tetratricopeptide repeat protein [Mycobacteriaceae bacterium]
MSGAVDLSSLKDRPAAPEHSNAENDLAGGANRVVDVTEASFETEVLTKSSQVPVIVALLSMRSDACLQLAATLEQLAYQSTEDWVFARVDVDVYPRIAQAFGVQAVPTVVALAAGQPIADFQGLQPKETLAKWIASLLQATEGKLSGLVGADSSPTEVPEDLRFTAAEEALDAGDFDAAKEAYQQILDSEPGNSEALSALRQVNFIARASNVAQDAVAIADADPENIELQCNAADVELLSQQPDLAFRRLIALVRRTSGDDRTKVRTRLLELFELFDPADPVVSAARRTLASALY